MDLSHSISCADRGAVLFGLYPIAHGSSDRATITKYRRTLEDLLMAHLERKQVSNSISVTGKDRGHDSGAISVRVVGFVRLAI